MTTEINPPSQPNNTLLDIQTTAHHHYIKRQQTLLRRLEPALFIFMIVYGALVLLSQESSVVSYAILGLFSINVILYFFKPQQNSVLRLLSAIIAIVISGVLFTLSANPSNAMIAFFYLLTVYYSFVLPTSQRNILIGFVVAIFVFSFFATPHDNNAIQLSARLGLLIILGVLMGRVRIAVNRSQSERYQLIHDLQQARDTYAKELLQRTSELEKEIQDRKQTESQLARDHQLLQTVIDTVPNRLFVKDRQSRFRFVNQQSLKALNKEGDREAVIGKTDFDFYPEFAERTFSGEQNMMETGRSIIDWEETTIGKDGVERHYLISKVPMYDIETDEVVGLVGVTSDITSLKQAQLAQKQSEESLRLFQYRLKILNQLTLDLTRIETFDKLVYESIKQGLDLLNFSRLNCWFIDLNNPNQLIGAYRVDQHGNIISSKYEVQHLTESHPAYDIVAGIQKNYVIYDAPIYDMELREIGRGDKAYASLLDGDKVIGCLYTDNLLDQDPLKPFQIELFNLYGATLGVLFNRQRAQEALTIREEEARDFQQQLTMLNEVTLQLELTDSIDELCKQAVILGRKKLRFERLGIWLVDDDNPSMSRGTWGTDTEGNLRDERDITIPIPEHQNAMQSEGEIIVLQNQAVDFLGDNLTNVDWILNGLLWHGTKRIGWLSVDNGLHGQPLTRNRQELFRLYTATISLLYIRQLAHNQLRESEIRYRAITEASSDVITIVNREMIVTYISPSLKVGMSVDPAIIIGQPITKVIHENDVQSALDILQMCMETPQLHTRLDEFRVRHADGHWVHMEAVMTSQIDDPIIQGVVISCRDLTERMEAEERKRIVQQERERADVLRSLISDISHDFRTPLSTISTTAYLLKMSNTNIEQRLEVIHQQIKRMTTLIDNFSTVTRLDELTSLETETINLNTILSTIPHSQSQSLNEKQLSFQLDLQEPLPLIKGNVGYLRDAIYHVVDNAIQFSDLEDAIHIRSYQEDSVVVVQVSDTGVGIANEDLPFVFNRLYRVDKSRNTDTGGGGLGLAITQRIIELHQGTIDIHSQLDKGTMIRIRLPYHDTHQSL